MVCIHRIENSVCKCFGPSFKLTEISFSSRNFVADSGELSATENSHFCGVPKFISPVSVERSTGMLWQGDSRYSLLYVLALEITVELACTANSVAVDSKSEIAGQYSSKQLLLNTTTAVFWYWFCMVLPL